MRVHVKSALTGGPLFEALERRLLLSAGPDASQAINDLAVQLVGVLPPANDLAVEIGALSAHSALPGDKVSVPVIVTNRGSEAAKGVIHGEIWRSEDVVVGDDMLTASGNLRIVLDPGESLAYTFKVLISADSVPGDFYWLAKISAVSGIDDPNPLNDYGFSADSVNEMWKFGTFSTQDGLRKNFKLKVKDQNGQLVTFSLSGGGEGEVEGGEGIFDLVTLTNTTSTSAMKISGQGSQPVSVGGIWVGGPLKSFSGKTTNLSGDFTATGVVSGLLLGDVMSLGGTHTIAINDAGTDIPDPSIQCSINLGVVSQTSLYTVGIPIKSLTVMRWVGDASQLTAPWIGSLTVKGGKRRLYDDSGQHSEPVNVDGDFRVNMYLDPYVMSDTVATPAVILRKATIAADVEGGQWEVNGAVGAIAVKKDVSNLTVELAGSLTSFTAAQVSDTSLTSDGYIRLSDTLPHVDSVIGSIQALSWAGGTIEADSIGAIRVIGGGKSGPEGYLDGAILTVRGTDVVPGKLAMGSLSLAGVMNNVVASIGGNVGSVTTAWMLNSSLLIGCSQVTRSAEDFSDGAGGYNAFTLKSLTLKGYDTGEAWINYFESSTVGAWSLSALKFGKVPVKMSGTLEVHDLDLIKITNEPAAYSPEVLVLTWEVG